MFRAPLRLLAAVLGLGAAGWLRAEFSAEQLTRIDRAFQGDVIALAPDGKHVAYSSYEEHRLSLVILDLETKTGRSMMVVADLPGATAATRLLYLHWPLADRVVFETSEGDVIAVNADGSSPLKLWDKNKDGRYNAMFQGTRRGGKLPASRILPALPDDSAHVILETATNAPNQYKIDVHTGEPEIMHDGFYHMATRWPPMFSDAAPTFVPETSLYINGRMLYDRQENPRLLYAVRSYETDREFFYTAAGDDPWNLDPNDPRDRSEPMTTFDAFLGQKKKNEFLITPKNYFDDRSFPLAFDYDPNLLYYASNVGRDTYAIYRMNLATRERTEILTSIYDLAGFEPQHPDNSLVFDDARKRLVGVRINALRPQTAWLDPELATVQAGLDRINPRQNVELLEWTPDRSRFLVRISSEDNPGRYAVVNNETGDVSDVLKRAPWLAGDDVSHAGNFAFDTPGGVHLTGTLTLPNQPKLTPPPLIIYCQGNIWDRGSGGFNRESQALASLGVVVMNLNTRGTSGFGRSHLLAVKDGLDTVPIEDITAALDWIAGKYPIDRKRVIIMGEGFGGYVALRGLQLHPELFRAGISINAPTSLRAWTQWRPNSDSQADEDNLQNTEFLSEVRANFVRQARGAPQPSRAGDAPVKAPMLVIEDSESEDTTPFSTFFGLIGIGMKGTDAESLTIKGSFRRGSPETRLAVIRRIDEFLNDHLYDFNSSIGELRVLPDETPKAPQPAKR